MNLACMKFSYYAMYAYNIVNDPLFVYVDDSYHGNAVSRYRLVQWNRNRFQYENKTSVEKWITL